ILLLPENPLLVASRPILTSVKEGPIRGTLVVGRYLDDAELERLSENAHLSLALRRYDDAQMPSDFRTARSFFLDADSDAERASFFVRGAGYRVYRRIRPAGEHLWGGVSHPESGYAQGNLQPGSEQRALFHFGARGGQPGIWYDDAAASQSRDHLPVDATRRRREPHRRER
ncbi:MAG: hypothetical protein GY835_18670, partial [bacterium]|nr:hypothetical protein [bacterium]